MGIRKIISPLLILLYLSAVIGLGFYNCHCEHSERLVLLTYNHCECAHEGHSHCDDDETNCPNTLDDKDCCNVVYKTISIDQEQSLQQIKKITNTVSFVAVILPLLLDLTDGDNQKPYSVFCDISPYQYKTQLIYHNCQLRL